MNKFVQDSLITSISRAINLLLALGTSVILARILGPDGMGIYSLAILLPVLAIIFTNFGIDSASAFYAGRGKYSPDKILGNNIIISGFLSILGFLAGLIIIFFFGEKLFHGVPVIYLLLTLSIIPCQLFFTSISSILWGLQKIKEYNFVSILQSFVFLVFIVIFFLAPGFGIKTAIISQIISSFLAGMVLFFLIKRVVGPFSLRLNKSYLKDSFSYGMKMYFGGILTFLYQRLNVFIINFFINPLAVGFYFIAKNFAEKILLIPQSVSFVLFSKVSSEKDKNRLKEFTALICRNSLFVTIVCIAIFFLFGRWLIVFLYSTEFLDSVSTFKILLIASIFMGAGGPICSDLAARGKPMINNYLAIFQIALNIILSILLIPKFGIRGAAWAVTISSMMGFVIGLIVYRKISGNKIKDVIFIKRSDIVFYKNFLNDLKNRIKP